MLPQPVGVLKFMLHLFCTVEIPEIELYLVIYAFRFNMGLCLDTNEPIFYNYYVSVSPHTSTLCSFIPFLIDLDLYSRSQGYGKARTCADILLLSGME